MFRAQELQIIYTANIAYSHILININLTRTLIVIYVHVPIRIGGTTAWAVAQANEPHWGKINPLFLHI